MRPFGHPCPLCILDLQHRLQELCSMLTIRLALGGSKKRPFYHLTVTDSRNPRDGSHKEQIGFFNPVARGQEIRLSVNQERLAYWLSVGAQPSERVASLLKESAKAAA